MSAARTEELLRKLWARSFTAVSADREAWLEAAFIRRGQGVVEHLYPDRGERQRLYHYGFTPLIGRRFEPVAVKIREQIAAAADYGDWDAAKRIDLFESIGALLEADRGFGFRVRTTKGDEEILDRWNDVLGWWMHEPGAKAPPPDKLRAWQRFVTDNLEFRLGVAIGAVVAQAWNEGTAEALTAPSLADWKETAALPWFGFWARELLRWGTHDPFVAFSMAQGLAPTREAASLRRARLTGTSGERGAYAVLPVIRGEETRWLDPAGFELAVTAQRAPGGFNRIRSDFQLRVTHGQASVQRVFRAG
jgi:hypothetical protein